MQDIKEQKYLLPYQPPVDVDVDLVQDKHYDADIYARAGKNLSTTP